MTALEVVRAGPLTTVQDEGRTGLAHLGVPPSGAVDLPALRSANRALGNPAGYAGLEITVTGCTLRARTAVTAAVTGALADVTVDGVPVEFGQPFGIPPGGTLKVGAARQGVRTYLAVAGGIAVPPVLGSRATDTLSGLGPPPVRDGDVLPIGDVPAPPAEPATPVRQASLPGDLLVRVRLGPRDDWFTPSAIDTLFGSRYQVSPTSSRIGVRLTGPALTRTVAAELPSEGVVLGGVQVPSGGEPLVFLADHPTTGGYPVIAVVERADLWGFAQARPGTGVRFQPATRRHGSGGG